MDANGLPDDIEQLKALLLQSHQRVAELSSTNTQLTSTNAQLNSTLKEQSQKLSQRENTIKELLAALRGKRRERIDPSQLLLFELGELEEIIREQQEAQAASPVAKRRRKHGRRVIPDGLPTEVIQHELPEDERICPVDGQVMQPIRWEESKQLDYVPARIKVILHRRAVYACPMKHDQAKLLTADKPPQPIEKGLAAAGLLAQVVVSKFGDHLPGYRQEDIFSRHKIQIRRSTIYDWLAAVADLCLPLYQLMKQQVLQSKVIDTDDTSVQLIDKSRDTTRTARFWAYLGDKQHPYHVYDFTDDRSRAGPATFLKGYCGYLQADAYSAYDGLYLDQGDDAGDSRIVEVACWAHCRRYWHKARESSPEMAHQALAYITRLYEVERATAQVDTAARKAARQEHAVPLLEEMKQWLESQSWLPKSEIGKAARYTLNQWEALGRYVEDGDLSAASAFCSLGVNRQSNFVR